MAQRERHTGNGSVGIHALDETDRGAETLARDGPGGNS